MRGWGSGKRRFFWLAAGGVMALVSLLLQLAARYMEGFGEWYSVRIYPALVGTLGRFCGLFPFSVIEIGIYILFATSVYYLIRFRGRWRELPERGFLLFSFLFLLFTVNCGVNYYRYPFSAYSGLEVRERSREELVELCLYLTEKVNELAPRLGTAGGPGVGTEDFYRQNAAGLASEGRRAMERLGQSYPQLSGFYPQPKAVEVSEILSSLNIAGIYSPFTVEANYNQDIWGYNIPLTICHELSHLKGFMREDEANFIGYLACIRSDDEALLYSGYLSGWIYATNELLAVDRDAFLTCYRQLDQTAVQDLGANNRFWDRYDTKAAEVSNRVNDTYLKINSQADGVYSYNRVVDLMLAYHGLEK